jgi:hypothetical protein
MPLVVLDLDGAFAALRDACGETMLTGGRRYINPEDLGLFTVCGSAEEALAALRGSPTG